jgi:SAM-dependent methyltransferase
MGLPGALAAMWKRAMLAQTAFSGRTGKLRLLYSLKDPWEMASEREQHRFAQTSAQLVMIAPRYDSILELGCGEGHQSVHLQKLTDHLYGVELSAQAVARACRRCPEASFVAAEIDRVPELFPDRRFDLITACEVLYYARDPGPILPALKSRCRYLYVSNYLPRSERMRHHFQGEGWRALPQISHGDTVWECFLWDATPER